MINGGGKDEKNLDFVKLYFAMWHILYAEMECNTVCMCITTCNCSFWRLEEVITWHIITKATANSATLISIAAR